MARYLMANRRSGKVHEAEKHASRASLDTSFQSPLTANVQAIGDTNPDDEQSRRVVIFEADPVRSRDYSCSWLCSSSSLAWWLTTHLYPVF